MIYNILALNYIKTTDKLKYFNLSILSSNNSSTISKTYLGDVEYKNSEFATSAYFNIAAISATNSGLIHNLYDANDMFYKSAITIGNVLPSKPSTYSFQNFFLHRLNSDYKIDSLINVNNIIYAIGSLTLSGYYYLTHDIYNELSIDNNRVLPSCNTMDTYLFNRNKLSDDMSVFINNLTTINDVKYNLLFEIPANSYIDHNSGSIPANVYKTKNELNQLYDMEHEDSEEHNPKYVLKNSRNYANVDHCNLTVYLKYYSNINYKKQDDTTNNLTTESKSYCSKINSALTPRYQLLEVVNKLNRNTTLASHKTNLYSLNINTDIFKELRTRIANSTSESSALKNLGLETTLKREIEIFSKSLVKKFAPANTQLLSVYINDN